MNLNGSSAGQSHRNGRPRAGVGLLDLAPPPAALDALGDSEHFVHFYEADDFLLDRLADYSSAALGAGDGCVVVATPAHREGLECRLAARGVDAAAARARGQFFSLDARQSLDGFMAGATPDPDKFFRLFGGVVARASDGGRRRVRAFGEMVALLWVDGNQDAALRLEELWTRLQGERPFQLFCAYPMRGFGGAEMGEALRGVCATHTRVVPAESYAALDCDDGRLRAVAELQQKAAALEGVKDELEQLLVREQAARVEAERASRLKDEFLATVSHELRTPLSAIVGWLHMIRSGRLDPAMVAHGLEVMERNAQMQAQLVEDILDMSRIIRGKLRLKVEAVDAAAVVGAAVESVQLAADAKGIRLSAAECGMRNAESAFVVMGDAGRLQQAVWNLLSNAIKFTPRGGRVEVRLGRAGDCAEIAVSDTGQGIAPGFLPHVFESFRQADSSTTRAHGGLGIGLALVRHLLELHGGSVRAESAGEGEGATFMIRLPLARPGDEAAEAPSGD